VPTPSVTNLSTVWPHVPVRTWSSSTWGEIALSPDGSYALGVARAADPPHLPVGAAIIDRTSGVVTVVRAFSNRDLQVVSIAGDNDWIAWVEASQMPDLQDWILYSYDRRSGQIRTLAAAPKPNVATPFVMISMADGVIVWSAVEAPDGIFHVYAINADGSNLRVIAHDARGPQIVWPWVVYDVKPSGPGAPSTLVRHNLETGAIEPIAGPTNVSYFAYDGEGLAWVSGDGTEAFLQSPLDSRAVQIASGSHLQFMCMNRRLVGWGQDQGTMVYDRKLRVVVQLSNLLGFNPVMSDQALDWLYQPNPSASNPFEGTVWRDVNVSDLPT